MFDTIKEEKERLELENKELMNRVRPIYFRLLIWKYETKNWSKMSETLKTLLKTLTRTGKLALAVTLDRLWSQ